MGTMKSPTTIILVAVASSLATVATLNLAQESQAAQTGKRRTSIAPLPAVDGAPTEVTAVPMHFPEADRDVRLGEAEEALLHALEARLGALEERLEAVELGSSERRQIIPRPERKPQEEAQLRDLVLDWVAEDRQARAQAASLADEEEERLERQYESRYEAMMFAKEHDLEEWQRDEFARLFLERDLHASEIEQEIDPTRDDPEEVEARWLAFDEWIDQRERDLTQRIAPELYEELYGEDAEEEEDDEDEDDEDF